MGCLVEKAGSSSWHKVFYTLKWPEKEFAGSKAYAENYGSMRFVKDNQWAEAFNDPSWIRFLTSGDK